MPYDLDTIHPLFIHFPIALLFCGCIFDIMYIILKRQDLEHTSFWCMFSGIITGIISNFTGLMAFQGQLIDLINFTHSIISVIAIILFIFFFIIRIKFQLDLKYSIMKKLIYLSLHIIAVIILFYGAHLGAIAAERI